MARPGPFRRPFRPCPEALEDRAVPSSTLLAIVPNRGTAGQPVTRISTAVAAPRRASR
jgi:hypothetical protein